MRRVARLTLVLGVGVIVAAIGRVHAGRSGYDFTGTSRFAWSVAYILLHCVTAYATGLPDVVRGRRAIALAVGGAPLLAALGVSVIQLFLGDSLLPRFVVFGAVVLLAPWYLVCVAAASGGRAVDEERDRVLLLGEPSEAESLRIDLRERPERPAQLVAVLRVEEALGAPPGRLEALVAEVRATLVVLNRQAQSEERLVHQVAGLHERGIRVRTLALFSEQWLGKLPVSELERTSLMFDVREVHRLVYWRVARLLDLTLSALGVLAFLGAVPLVALANLVGNRGPLFYRQVRVGKNGELFDIVKFRTMRPNDGRMLNEWTTEDDPRITSFGRVLRRTHLDELPQVVNIIRGDLSVVGPRPEQPHYVEELTAKIPFYNLRHLVRPGLTGWAQVKYGYAGSESDALEKLQYEFYYLRHQGFLLDIRIMGRTVRSVFGRRGR